MRIKAFYLFFLFFAILNYYAQSVPLRFVGKVSDERTNLSGVTLQVTKAGKVLNNILTDLSGKYAFELPLGAEYMVTVSKQGYVSKRFSVSTLGIPPEMASQPFPSIEASLTLFKKMEGIDYSILNQPINKFYFDTNHEDFVYDAVHLKQMKKELDKIKEQEEILIQQEKQREENYLSAIKSGDKALSKKEYESATNFYIEAQAIKSEEIYPAQQLEKIKNLKADELSKQKAEEAAAAKALADKQAAEKLAAELALKAEADKLAKEKAAADALAKKQAEEIARKKEAEETAAKALLAKQAADKATADALAKKKADEAAAKKAAEVAEAKTKAEKAEKEKAEAEALLKKREVEANAKKAAETAAALALAEKLAKEKKETDAKKATQEAEAKALADQQAKEKLAAAELVKKQEEEAAAKKAAETAATIALAEKLAKEKTEAAAQKAKEEAASKALIEKQLKEKNDAEILAKKQVDEEAAAKAKATKELAAKQEKEKVAKDKADALVKKQADEATAKKAAEEAAAKAKAAKVVLPVLGATETKYQTAIKKADEAFGKHRYYDAKEFYQEALMAKSGDAYAKTRLMECEKNINSDTNQKVNERQKELLAKYPPGVTETIIPGEGLVIIQRVLVKDKTAFMYEKKVFNWGGIACFRDGEPITELTFEQETRK